MKTTINTILITIAQTALLLSCLQMKAQGTPSVPDVPPSPQAVAFNRLGDYQVNNNYGAPDISIPLFEIDYYGFKIPLSLHYEASPMKSGYNYDVTGRGWTLSGNSCVSRTIKDRADEYGMFNNPFELDSFQDTYGNPRLYVNYANELDRLNFQYDSYNIVLPSGRTIPFFMYKTNGVMHYDRMYYDSHVKIECSYSTNSIDAFTVTDESGVIYHFTEPEMASNILQNDPNALRNVTWLLTSIDIPAKGTIYYQYTSQRTINTNVVGEPVMRICRLMSKNQEDYSEIGIHTSCTLQSQSPRYTMKFLSRILYGPSKVDFNYTNDGLHMSEIVVSDCSETIRRFTLGISGSSLTSLVISSPDNTESLRYGFSYTNNSAGDRVDYWGNRCNSNSAYDIGNFNMFVDNAGLDWNTLQTQFSWEGNLVQIIANEPDDLNYFKLKLQTTANGDTRQPIGPQRHGVLTSITYPNGGITTFNWENHRFLTATAADGDFVFDRRSQRIIEGGGFRIESIKNYTADGAVASEDYYRYGFTLGDIIHRNFPLPLPDNLVINNSTDTLNHHIGCGEAVVDPNLLTFMTYSYSPLRIPSGFRQMLLGLHSGFENVPLGDGGAWWWDAYFSANTFRSLLGGRRPVVYPEITVYHKHPFEFADCKSKTVYKYDIYDYYLSPNTYYQSFFNQTAVPDTAYFEPPCYFGSRLRISEHPGQRHQLKTKSDYSFNSTSNKWELVSEESYSHSEEEMSKSGSIYCSEISRGHCSRHTLQYGTGRLLSSFTLSEFYQSAMQYLGRSTLTGKSTTTLRQGGTRTLDNKQSEVYSYLYSGVLKSKDYYDLPYGIRRDYSDYYDKEDLYSYVGEESGNTNTVIATMKSRNMLASLLTAETFTFIPNMVRLTGSKIDYGDFNGSILPSMIYESNGDLYEQSIEVKSYDSHGNPTEILDKKTGIYSVFLWDTYDRYLIAMIKDARLSQIPNITQLRAATSQVRRSMLLTTFPNALIQTWNYLPLVGVSSHTDVNGQTFLYEYDGLGRLKSEKRVVNGVQAPEILHRYEYNYMNQQ